MADDNNARYRSGDPYGRAPAAGGQPANDPLAELARLIGQNDPFAQPGRDGRQSAPVQYGEPSRDPHYANQAPAPEWHGAPPPAPMPPIQQHSYDPFARPAPQVPAPSEQHYAPQGYGDPHAPAHGFGEAHGAAHGYAETPMHEPYAHQPYSDAQGHTHGHDPYGQPGADSHHQAYATQPYDPGHGAHPAEVPGFQPMLPAAYRRDDSQSDEYYDDAPQGGRRRGLVTIVAVLCLAVIGTAGAFAYRSMFGAGSSSGPPPVIRASTEPSKVAPPPGNTDPSSSKLSYDRFGDRSQNEQVVTREEQPLEPRDLARTSSPRVVLPGAPVPSSGASSQVAASAPGNAPSALGEPKRVRTVPIRPDQPESAARPQPVTPTPVAPSRPTAVAAAAPANVPLEVTQSSPPPLPAPVRSVAPRSAAAQASANAPLSLNPESSALPPPAAREPAPARTRLASAPAGNGGGYLVQVSSQRSEADAQSSYRSIQSKYSSVLGDRQVVIRRADLGEKGTYYRAMVGPFQTREQAIQLCGSLKAAGGDCVVQAN